MARNAEVMVKSSVITQKETYNDGRGPYQVVDAWNGAKRTPLAVVMSSGSMFCHVLSHSPFEWSRELDSFETAKRAWDDFNLTITWYNGGGPYQVLMLGMVPNGLLYTTAFHLH